jgi:uncharacterized membrane protein YkoI
MNGRKTKQALVTVLGVSALGLTLLGSVYAQSAAQSQTPGYQSSIRLPDQGDDERAEAARLSSLAKIDAKQAMAAAIAKVPGTVLETKLDNENGNLVYSVEIKVASNEVQEVKVDAGNGAVLHVETGGEEQDDAGERSNAIMMNPLK